MSRRKLGVLLAGAAGLRERELSKPLGWLGLPFGLVGILSVFFATGGTGIAFGLFRIGHLETPHNSLNLAGIIR